MFMDGLLIATGFTGALALLWLMRRIVGFFSSGPRLAVSFGPKATETLVREIGKARREVLLLGSSASPGLGRALAEARRNKAALDVLLDPDADATPFDQQGLAPRPASRSTPAGLLVVIDDATVLLADSSAGDGDGQVVVARGFPDLVQSCRQQFASCHPASRATAAPPPQSEPTPGGAPVPTIGSPTAPSYPQPPSAVDDLLAAVARGAARPAPAEDEEHESANEPPITRATAELFARLRKEVATAAGQNDSTNKAA